MFELTDKIGRTRYYTFKITTQAAIDAAVKVGKKIVMGEQEKDLTNAQMEAIESAEKAAIKKGQPQKPAKSERYIEFLSTAERHGLKHGRAWVASENDTTIKGAPAGSEGELVCYVYS